MLLFIFTDHLFLLFTISFLCKLLSPLLEVTVEDSAWEALSADSDAFQHTITPQLVDDQMVLHKTCTLCKISQYNEHLGIYFRWAS